MVSEGWKKAAFPFKEDVQVMFECCSLNDTDVAPSNDTFGYPRCAQVSVKLLEKQFVLRVRIQPVNGL